MQRGKKKKYNEGSRLNLDEPDGGGGGRDTPGGRGGDVRGLRAEARPKELEQS